MKSLTSKTFLTLLALEILTIPIVVCIFKFLEPRNVAALCAGSLFIALGFYILTKVWRSKSSLTLYMAILHLFAFAIPMITVRILNWNADFNDLYILGMKGPSFHRTSETVFTILIVCTLIDLVRTKLIKD